MEDEKIDEVAIQQPPAALKRVREIACVLRPQPRSPLYWWLFNHAQELLQAETDCGGEFPWVEMCGDFALAGFILSDGKVVTARTARATWQRVRGELPYVGQADAVIKS